jgi:hypothetical protein
MNRFCGLLAKIRNCSVPVFGEATLMFSTGIFLSDDENAIANAIDVKMEFAPPKECPVCGKSVQQGIRNECQKSFTQTVIEGLFVETSINFYVLIVDKRTSFWAKPDSLEVGIAQGIGLTIGSSINDGDVLFLLGAYHSNLVPFFSFSSKYSQDRLVGKPECTLERLGKLGHWVAQPVLWLF